jgi:hypothetical protein
MLLYSLGPMISESYSMVTTVATSSENLSVVRIHEYYRWKYLTLPKYPRAARGCTPMSSERVVETKAFPGDLIGGTSYSRSLGTMLQLNIEVASV